MLKNHCKSTGSRYSILMYLLLGGIWLAAGSQPVQAEPYLRVCKNGVIYYYFSQKGSQSGRPALVKPGKVRTVCPPHRARLTAQDLEPLIQEASRHHGLPSSLVKAVIRVESNFNPGATSPKGAQGLMQLMPETAAFLQVSDPYDIRENVWAGSRYLRLLLDRFNFRLPLALAAYNAGPQRVSQRQEVPPIRETQDFVRDVCTNFLKYATPPPTP